MANVTDRKLKNIIEAIERLEYGSLNITVHDGEITQVDITEKNRFPLAKKTKAER